ncbi:hypothetical protein ACP275_05G041900 [Erythranthe tilingii]
MAESVDLPGRLAILPFRNKVLLPAVIIRIRCTPPSSVSLVEQDLRQREGNGIIGILTVRDALLSRVIGVVLDATRSTKSKIGGEFDELKRQFMHVASPQGPSTCLWTPKNSIWCFLSWLLDPGGGIIA